MCGLLFTNDPNVSNDKFSTALTLLHHRGPDATDHTTFGACRLGHTRLKILDLDNRSNQPFISANGRYSLIYNGEVYNFAELATQHNILPRTTSDTEIIVELYARFGPSFVNWLNGMFAIVILDLQTLEVFAARDRLGVKPLYFCQDRGTTTLSSEIAPVLELSGRRDFDDVGLRQYRKLRTFFNGRTPYKGIEMFPAGHYLHSGKLHRYWSLPESDQQAPSDEELRSLIIDAVQMRLVADVPVGTYLSGGLDSTIVATVANTSHTWTVGFADHNEFTWSRMAAEQLHSNHHEVLIDAKEFISLAKQMIHRRLEPLSVPNEVLLYAMTKEVRRFNTVVLSGEGADELFFGYDRVFRWAQGAHTWDVREFANLYAYGSNDDVEIVEDAVAPFVYRGRPLDIVAHFFQVAHLHGLLRRLDNATMLTSVEARVPFVDHHPLIERMAGVSFDYRMQDGIVKAPLKRIFGGVIPESIVTRQKVGFPVPLNTISFGGDMGQTPMDQWLEFNLFQLMGTPYVAHTHG